MQNKHFIIVGLGSIGQRHLNNIRDLYPKSLITIVRHAGKSGISVEKKANHIVKTIPEAIEIMKPTAGIIASPSPFHIDNAKVFIDNHCPIFIEKPLSHNLDGIAELIALADNNNTNCMVAYVLRFLPTMEKIKQIIKSNQYGKVLHSTVSVGQYLPDWRPKQDYRNNVSAQHKMGGGALLELSHEIDYLLYLFGVPNEVVSIIQNTGRLDIDVEDQVDAILQYKSGKVIHLHLDFLQKVAKRYCYIVFEEAQLKWDIIKGSLEINTLTNEMPIIEEIPYLTNDTYINEFKHFMRAVSNKEDLKVDLKDGLKVLELIEELKKSSNYSITVEHQQ